MVSLEDKLRPASGPDDGARDAVGMGLLLALAAVLIPPLWEGLRHRWLTDLAGQMASPLLPAAAGFLLALRCGAVDLSVWAVFAGGGLLGGSLIVHGIPPAQAFTLAAGAGAAAGLVHGLLVAGLRIPSPAVTLLSAVGIAALARACVPAGELVVPDAAFQDWHLLAIRQAARETPDFAAEAGYLPLLFTRVFLVGGLHGVVLLALAAVRQADRAISRPRLRLARAAALTASGALAAAGGCFWLLDSGRAAVPARLIGDLRIPAAALLAGGALFTRRHRALLACLCLPPALLLATLWRQDVFALFCGGLPVQMLLLIAMVLTAQAALARATRRAGRKPSSVLAAILCPIGMLVFGGSVSAGPFRLAAVLHAAGLLAWLWGAVALVLSLRSSRRLPTTALP